MKRRLGSVTISLAPCTVSANGRKYQYYRLRYWQDGKLQRPTFPTLEAAEAAASAKLEELNRLSNTASVTPADAASLARARELLTSLVPPAPGAGTELAGLPPAPDPARALPVELAVSEYVEARKKLPPGISLETAVHTYNRTHPGAGAKPFPEIVAAFLAHKAVDGTLWRQRTDLKQRLTRLAGEIPGPLVNHSAAEISALLKNQMRQRSWTSHTYNQYLAALRNCCNYARAEQLLPREWAELEHVKKFKVQFNPREADPPEKVAGLLQAVPADMLPALVIRYFCVIRSAELHGRPHDQIPPLDWEDIDLKHGELKVRVSKVRDRKRRRASRMVDIPKNAVAWLRPHQKVSGPIYEGSEHQYLKRLRAICRKLGFEWTPNAGRRTAASLLQVDLERGGQELAAKSGTSRATMRRHYIDPQTRLATQQYAAILPRRSGKGKLLAVAFSIGGQKNAKKTCGGGKTRRAKSG